MTRLWETDHPYYCAESNYLCPRNRISGLCEEKFSTWTDFLKECGDLDTDMNLLLRFDWKEGEDWDLPPFEGDTSARIAQLCLYYLGQRKGHFYWKIIDVCRDEEPAIREWLAVRFEKIKELWKPFA